MTEFLSDPAEWAEAVPILSGDEVAASIPQRHEMLLLHGILHHDAETAFAIGYHESTPDDFWVRGHVPGRPLMPGVVMVEAAAQLCAFVAEMVSGKRSDQMFGFAGLEQVRFRGQVVPGDRLVIMVRAERVRRLSIYASQAFVGSDLVYEGRILGMSI